MKKKYFKNIENNHIYKQASDKDGFKYLKVTPWESNEDRRTNINELKKLQLEGKVIEISSPQAREELNEAWNNVNRFWIWNDKQYKTIANDDFHKAKKHIWNHVWTDTNGESHITNITFYIVMFHGQLYWTQNTQYYPRQQLLHFRGMDIEPDYRNDYAQWTSAKNLRPIYTVNENNEWETI